MMFIKAKYFWLISIYLLTLSCNQNSETKTIDKQELKNNGDTTHLINLVKSFEPKIYKGKVSKQFYDNRGFYDFWRFPLVYPYSIGCIDVRDYGNIYNDIEKIDYDEGGSMSPLTDYFDRFIFDRFYLIASKCRNPMNSDTSKIVDQNFVFSFANGTIKSINGQDNLKKTLKSLKFNGDTTFISIKEYDQKL